MDTSYGLVFVKKCSQIFQINYYWSLSLPVWSLRWTLRLPWVAKLFSQTLHLHSYTCRCGFLYESSGCSWQQTPESTGYTCTASHAKGCVRVGLDRWASWIPSCRMHTGVRSGCQSGNNKTDHRTMKWLVQSTLDISNSDILNSANLEVSLWIKIHFDCFLQP